MGKLLDTRDDFQKQMDTALAKQKVRQTIHSNTEQSLHRNEELLVSLKRKQENLENTILDLEEKIKRQKLYLNQQKLNEIKNRVSVF